MEAGLEAADAGERIREASEAQHHRDEQFRRLAAVGIGVLALLLALANFGGATATKETINNNILASDAYNFFQAKNIRQTANQLAIDELETLLLTQPGMTSEARAHIQQQIDEYTATVARYESDPTTGEGKKELLDKAQDFTAHREHAQKQTPNFEYAAVLLQIGIVLGSVSIVAGSRPLLAVGVGLGVFGALLALNGQFLVFQLPGG
jgi:Domain of unknown function (DUF4337)